MRGTSAYLVLLENGMDSSLKGHSHLQKVNEFIGGGTVWDKGGAPAQGAKPRVPPNPVFSSNLGHLFFVKSLDTVNIFFKKKKLKNFSPPLNAWLT